MPGMNGSLAADEWWAPDARPRVRLVKAEAVTETRTSPSFGIGSSNSPYTGDAPSSRTIAAFIVPAGQRQNAMTVAGEHLEPGARMLRLWRARPLALSPYEARWPTCGPSR